MNKLEQIKALENGKGIRFLLYAAYKIFNNPIYMIDANYNLIAFTDVPVDDPYWNELVTTGTFSIKAQEFLAKEHMIENVVNSDKIAVVKSNSLEHRRMTGHIFNRDNIWVGLITIYEYTPFNAANMAAYEILTDKISNEIRDYEYFTTFGDSFYEDNINKLLSGTVKDPLLYNPQAQILYNGFKDYLYAAVVSIPRNNIQDNIHQNRLTYFKSLLKGKYPSYKYAIYSDYIVILMSSKHRYLCDTPFYASQYNFFDENDLFAGISGSFENIYELRNYYDQAVAALKNGIEYNRDKRIFLSET